MKKTFKILVVGLMYVVFSGCQKDFPPAPDYYKKPSINVTEKWRYSVPENERIVWVGSSNDHIVYLTNTFDEQKLTTYEFSKAGELITTQAFIGQEYAKYVRLQEDIHQNGDWISVKKGLGFYLFNYKTGKVNFVVNAQDFRSGDPFDFYLGTKNRCFYQVMRDNHLLAMEWDLNTDAHRVFDTIGGINTTLTLIGEQPNNNRYFDTHLLYLKYEFEFATYTTAYSLVGAYEDGLWKKDVWESDVIFRAKTTNYYNSAYIDEDYTAIVLKKELYLINHNMKELVWKKNTGWMGANVVFEGDRMYYVADNFLQSVSCTSGESDWKKGFGHQVRSISIDNGVLAFSSYRETSDDLYPSYSNQMHLVDKDRGEEMYRNADPLNAGIEVLDDLNRGLSLASLLEDNTLYGADHQNFMALSLSKN
jgi:hypothetical protein